MARISARMPMIAKITEAENGDITFTNAIAVGKMIKTTVAPVVISGQLAADDDPAAEDVTYYDGANITLNSSTLPTKAAVMMFGSKFTEASEGTQTPARMDYGKEDKSDYVAFGFISGEVVDGVKSFKLTICPKVKFTMPSDEYNTKGNSVTFGTPSISGKAECDKKDLWKTEYFFNTASEAIAYFKTLFTTA